MNSLSDFLLLRIAEDEHRAQTGQPFVGRVTGQEGDDWIEPNHDAWHSDLCGWRTGEGLDDECKCGVPARVLVECEAKRRILEVHPQDGGFGSGPGDCITCNRTDFPCPTLRLLALPYADHPDYREEWRP